jgi:histidinol-phosphate aminotransferase
MKKPLSLSTTRRGWLQSLGVASTGLALGALARRTAVAAPLVAAPLAEPTPLAPKGIIKLSLNESPWGPSPKVVEAVRRHATDLSRYPSDEHAAVTRQIAAFEGVSEDQVLLGEVLEPLGLHLGLQGSGGEFVYSSPGYTALVESAKPVGGVPIPVPLNSKLENDLEALAARTTGKTRALFLVNPHNPSGTVTPSEDLRNFIRDVSRRILVIVDEAYLEYTDDFKERTAGPLVAAGANVAVFRTFSKIRGLASLPFGYAVLPAPLAGELRARGMGNPHAVGRLSLIAAGESLADRAHVEKVRQLVKEERRKWHAWLDQAQLRHSDAQGNFIFFESARPQSEVAAALRRRGVEIGRSFPPLERWTRISIGLPAENAQARNLLREVLAG